MPESTDFAILARSIGEHSVSYIGRENLRALSVEVNPITMEAEIEIVLTDASEDNRRSALEALHEVEELFWDDIVVGHNFVGELHEHDRATADARRQFQYA
jgi:hypothetical protein